MRILIPLIATLAISACSKDTTDADPCARAIANADRLIKQDESAQWRYGEHPLTAERCRTASADEVSCMAYASDWQELERCAPASLQIGTR